MQSLYHKFMDLAPRFIRETVNLLLIFTILSLFCKIGKKEGNWMLPAYIRIHDKIKEDVDDGTWKIGQRLPSERDLCETLM